ncbi:hypothetical protein Taro_029344 [Colocasia esculenta]|uniref:Uncharacterized protein n=1 Tax=Colocasia esculenta TaxID=4460 RepID=A0A843VQV9_COLES|nr:hypothetical protein [Colocasia esculenta]
MRPSRKVSHSLRRSDGEGAHAPAVPSKELPSSLAGAFRTRAVALLRGTTPDITEQHVRPLCGSPAQKVRPKGTEQATYSTIKRHELPGGPTGTWAHNSSRYARPSWRLFRHDPLALRTPAEALTPIKSIGTVPCKVFVLTSDRLPSL